MLIHDVRPYPSRLSAIVSVFHGQAVSMNGKKINVSYESSTERAKRVNEYWLYDEEVWQRTGYHD